MHLFKAYARNTSTEMDRFTRSLTNGCGLYVAGAGWMSRVGRMILREIQVRVRGK